MRKLLFVSLGCDKNLVDSERMLALLLEKGFEMTDDEAEADVIVINTCCFIHDAQEESVDNILSMCAMKKTGKCRVLAVTGCMAQMYGQEIMDEIPDVDILLGTSSFEQIAEAVDAAWEGTKTVETDLEETLPKDISRISVTGGHTEYLKIAEGCDKHCTYCIIPSLRGKYRSVPMEELVAEARTLAAAGTKELILVAQETTLYGVDLYGKKQLHVLLKELCEIEGLRWIRVMYCYPEEIYPELVRTIAEEEKICHYLDLPIQHCSDVILKRMGRRTSRAGLMRIIGELREQIPDLAIRTSLITGFPAETQEQHRELLDFIREVRFDRLGVFTYSREDGTPAAEMDGQIDEEVKQKRRDELMLAQQDISWENGRQKIGTETEVFIEGYLPEEGIYIGRTRYDAPDVDGYIFVDSCRPLDTGDLVICEITDANEYDLTGIVKETGDEFTE